MDQRKEMGAERRSIRVEEMLHSRYGIVKEVVLSVGLDCNEVFCQTHVVDLERFGGRFGLVDKELETLVDRHHVRHVAAFGFGDFGTVTEDDVPGRTAGEWRVVVQDSNLSMWMNEG